MVCRGQFLFSLIIFLMHTPFYLLEESPGMVQKDLMWPGLLSSCSCSCFDLFLVLLYCFAFPRYRVWNARQLWQCFASDYGTYEYNWNNMLSVFFKLTILHVGCVGFEYRAWFFWWMPNCQSEYELRIISHEPCLTHYTLKDVRLRKLRIHRIYF